jgi:FAD/FMN-containing dehydrogenase
MTMSRYRSFGLAGPGAGRAIPAAEGVALLTAGDALPGSVLGFGNGRSYGDSCLNGSGTLIDMRGMNRILSFDPATGIIEAEAGTMLAEIIAHAAPHGWFPAVVPGTRFVTLGGAIANDIHGKNHHRRGSFGCHVAGFRLLRSDGRLLSCSSVSNPGLFAATIGGMGLTGLVLTVRLRLMRVSSPDVIETVTPFAGLDDYFDRAEAEDEANEYAVAWIDQLAGGRRAGRGLLLTANHAPPGDVPTDLAAARLSVPFDLPFGVLNRPSLTMFNAAYRLSKTRHREPSRSPSASFFFPLDGVRDWNRLYGPRGLRQHQSVVPHEAARSAIPELLEETRRAGQASFLTVLKRFGSIASPGLIPFARPGYTLTLDFPWRGATTDRLLDRLDAITRGAGGAVNPYKDANMSPATFAAGFSRWSEVEALRDPAFMSDFWRRTAGRLLSGEHLREAAE